MLRILLSGEESDTTESLHNKAKSYGFVVNFIHYNQDDKIFKTTNFDAIIIISLNNCYEVCQLITHWRKYNITIPIMVITEHMKSIYRKKFITAGADDIVQKSVTEDEIVRRLFAIMIRHNAIHQTVLRYGDLSLDSHTRTARLKDKKINLTVKETTVLEILLLQGNEVISVHRIAEKMRENYNNHIGNVIPVHISSLRKKLGKDLIETMRGEGYRLR